MGRIHLEDVEAGMILAAHVMDFNGRLLLGVGSEITERHIKIFKMWGVTEADIQGVEKEQVAAKITAQLDQLLVQEAAALGRELFRHTDLKHPCMEELFRLFTLRKVRQISEEDDHVT
ncbi:MAG: hypothetical protein HWN68_05325 [Desulfobacterales bacterium]|nr:hypothetical protein [Desulfobacterales bacterium]